MMGTTWEGRRHGGYSWRACATREHFLDPAQDESGEGFGLGLEMGHFFVFGRGMDRQEGHDRLSEHVSDKCVEDVEFRARQRMSEHQTQSRSSRCMLDRCDLHCYVSCGSCSSLD